jgi:hypothetical protein
VLAQAEALRFPLSMTPPMPDMDKKGEPCTVFDCCLNIDVIKMVSMRINSSMTEYSQAHCEM